MATINQVCVVFQSELGGRGQCSRLVTCGTYGLGGLKRIWDPVASYKVAASLQLQRAGGAQCLSSRHQMDPCERKASTITPRP